MQFLALLSRSAILAGIILLPSCANRIQASDAPNVNRGIDYLWDSDKTIAVRPGMKVIVHALPLRDKGRNDAPPAPTAYAWIAPRPHARLERSNVLFANFLAVSGMPQSGVSGSVEKDLASRAETLCADGACPNEAVARKYVDTILTPLFSTLRVQYFNRWSESGTQDSVEALKRKACEPSAVTLERPWDANTAANGALIFTYALNSAPVEYEVLGAGDWFLRGGRGGLRPDPKASDWYLGSGVGYTRGFAELQIPVRVGSSPTSTFFPVCTSVTDVENSIGQIVVGVRRSAAFVPENSAGLPLVKGISDDGYFTIWLDGRQAAEGLSGSQELKSVLMLGAGDILILGHGRLRPTDAPIPSWQM
ncbi:hypothetical protein [Rhizobium leguminosarum]|uniref:hypothetical protein n=1 Tax=Rhizobium leguminosarum TaxID=384 RepID=UPI003F98F658